MTEKEKVMIFCADLIEFVTIRLIDAMGNESIALRIIKNGVDRALKNKKKV